MDPHSEERLAAVHPKLAEKIRAMADLLLQESIEILVVQGLRTFDEQAALYAKGRDTNGTVIDHAQIVTNARPGTSWHQFGLAVDVAPFDGGIPDWNAGHPAWRRIVAVGESCGLVAGAEWRSFPDLPHFQLTGQFPVSPDDAVRSVFETGGIDGVWNDSGLDMEASA